jgi:hypothetical protein
MQPRRVPVEPIVLALFGVLAWVARTSPYFRPTGVLGWATDSDEGVYLSASWLLWHGVMPWRDFVFVHPPAVPVLLSFATVWDVTASKAFELARWGVTAVGALNVWLAATVVHRRVGFTGACVTAGLLCVWPEVLTCDRGVHLEPFLTAACLVAMWLDDNALPRRAWWAGAWFGLGGLVKTWAALWVVGWLLARGRKAVSGAVVAGGVVLLGFGAMLVLSSDALTQVILFHLRRPPDGDPELSVRLGEMFLARSYLPLVLLALGLPVFWWRRRDVFTRHLLLVAVLLIAAFLSAAAYWSQYNAHLAFPLAMLSGVAVHGWLERAPAFARSTWVAVVLGVLAGGRGFQWLMLVRKDADPKQAATVELLKREPPGPLCAFELNELLMADRWPTVLSGTRSLIDPYGQMLIEATEHQRYPSAFAAFSDESAQRTVRSQLEACPRWFLGWRGRWQLNDQTKAQLSPERLVDPLP